MASVTAPLLQEPPGLDPTDHLLWAGFKDVNDQLDWWEKLYTGTRPLTLTKMEVAQWDLLENEAKLEIAKRNLGIGNMLPKPPLLDAKDISAWAGFSALGEQLDWWEHQVNPPTGPNKDQAKWKALQTKANALIAARHATLGTKPKPSVSSASAPGSSSVSSASALGVSSVSSASVPLAGSAPVGGGGAVAKIPTSGRGRLLLQPRETQVHSQMMTCDPMFIASSVSNFNAVHESILQGDLMLKFEPTAVFLNEDTSLTSGYSFGSAQKQAATGYSQQFMGIAMATDQCLSNDHVLKVPVAGAGVISTLNRSNENKSFPAMFPITVDVETGYNESDSGRTTASLDSSKFKQTVHAETVYNPCKDTNLMSIGPSRYSEQLDVVVHL